MTFCPQLWWHTARHHRSLRRLGALIREAYGWPWIKRMPYCSMGPIVVRPTGASIVFNQILVPAQALILNLGINRYQVLLERSGERDAPEVASSLITGSLWRLSPIKVEPASRHDVCDTGLVRSMSLYSTPGNRARRIFQQLASGEPWGALTSALGGTRIS